MEMLRAFLERFAALRDAEWEAIAGACVPLQLPRGAYFLHPGQVNRRIAFITEGVCRYLSFDEQGREITRYFVKEGQFLSVLDSFRSQQPSELGIQALTEVEALAMDREAFDGLSAVLPAWEPLVRQVAEQALLEKVERFAPMLQQDARSRYVAFLREQPDVLRRVPLAHVASYLGIPQQSLSRLRSAR